MTDSMWITVGLGVIIGGIAVGIVLKKHKSVETATAKTDMLSELVKNQFVCEALDMENVTAWFRENANKAQNDAVFFLAKPTTQTAKMFAITGDIMQLKQEHNLLQVVVDKKERLPVAIRLISYNTRPDLITTHLSEKDYMIITNDK